MKAPRRRSPARVRRRLGRRPAAWRSGIFGLGLLGLAGFAAATELPPEALWRETVVEPSRGPRRAAEPLAYRALDLERTVLASLLSQAPAEGASWGVDVVVPLPLPDGGFGRFRVESYGLMAPELARRYREIGTYLGRDLDDPSTTVRFDLTPAGFHAQIFSPRGTVYIDPWRPGEGLHIVYRREDYPAPPWAADAVCQFDDQDEPGDGSPGGAPPEAGAELAGATLRTYRLAVAATGEYTQFHGGTVAAAIAAIVTAMNRVNGIYERDVAIRMVLVANNHQIVYTNPATDPYTASGSALLNQNQNNVDNVIGAGNYDIGHLFTATGGGLAQLGVPCGGSKARGLTGLSSPFGDPFYVDFVAHEMGHQWGANHTFNGTAGSCSGNRNGPTAYEPGSGSTIMAYAGICGAQNLQLSSDDYFHVGSLIEMVTYSTIGQGGGCAVASATGNSAPEVTLGGPKTLPLSTPFRLITVSTDPEGDPLTFTWEQYDTGPAGAPGSPTGNAPIFRSLAPTSDENRVFPKLSDLLANSSTIGEILPTYARTLHFRVTARDNRSAGGGVTWEAISFPVTDLAGPFLVTAPNTAVTWMGFDNELVTWDVAGTADPPVSCPNVDIQLSTDGGLSFLTSVASSTPNDGAQTVPVPNLPTATARLRITCSDSEFFDVSDADFTVLEDLAPAVTVSAPAEDAVFDIGDTIGFIGSALDAVEGDLSAGLAWSSNLDGTLGGGGSPVSALSAGYHTVTATVADSHGQPGTGAVHIVVEDPPACPASLSVTLDPAAGSTTYRAAGTVTLGPDVTVAAAADVTLIAGAIVQLADNLVVAGSLAVSTTPDPCS